MSKMGWKVWLVCAAAVFAGGCLLGWYLQRYVILPPNGAETLAVEMAAERAFDPDELAELDALYATSYLAATFGASSWDTAAELPPEVFVEFFSHKSGLYPFAGLEYQRYRLEAAEDKTYYEIPAELVEGLVQEYFDVEVEHIRKAKQYRPEQHTYYLTAAPGSGVDYAITGASKDGYGLTLDFEVYDAASSQQTVIRTGQVTVTGPTTEQVKDSYSYVGGKSTGLADSVSVPNAAKEAFTPEQLAEFDRLYLKNYVASGLAASCWEGTPNLGLLEFFCYTTRWSRSKDSLGLVPVELLDPFLQQYFGVSILDKTLPWYMEEENAYEPYGAVDILAPHTITGAEQNGNLLTLYYEVYHPDDTTVLLLKGKVTLERTDIPEVCRYVSGEALHLCHSDIAFTPEQNPRAPLEEAELDDLYINSYLASSLGQLSWQDPLDIPPDVLVRYFGHNTRLGYVSTDGQPLRVPANIVEQFLTERFGVDTGHLRQASSYVEEAGAYELPVLTVMSEEYAITHMEIDDGRLTIDYEQSSSDGTVTHRGQAVLEYIEDLGAYRYLSGTAVLGGGRTDAQ